MTSPALHLGIDLGTTNSAAAIFDGDKVTLVRNSQGGTLTPSVVRVDARGNVTVGAKARRFLETDPSNTRAEFKRLMGTAQAIDFSAAHIARLPEELAAEVLRSLRADVQEQLGFAPVRAVISVPALFELPQSAATSKAAALAGFEKVELIQEPVASALAAGWSADEATGHWLVYDFGGGTFDASLLETRDGMLRVVGHDGDNFLGGRDVDSALVDYVVAELAKERGVAISRSDPAHALAIRKLRHAAEEAKIELSRQAKTAIAIPELQVGTDLIDVDIETDRATLDRIAAPLIDRTVEVCQRLLAAHRIGPGGLQRIVLVGGPTVMPALRERVGAALGNIFANALDPMTLVAQGAAIYAATAGLDARPLDAALPTKARRVWIQHPAMSSDLRPHVVGRVVETQAEPAVARVRLARADGLWQSDACNVDAEGAFVIGVELLGRRPNVFRVEALDRSGAPIAVEPATFTIVQGLTISDPPLSRSIGIALANDTVRLYFERGAPLPARKTFMLHTVESIARGSQGFALKIPIVQGELDHAHLCRLVGTLEIRAEDVHSSLPAGSEVEITLEMDRGGRLSARALVPSLEQVFEEVAHLLVPEASPDVLDESIKALHARAEDLRADAFRRGTTRAVRKLGDVERLLAEAQSDIAAARGGDADAAQKARRQLLDVDALLEDVEADRRWPELDEAARSRMAYAASWVSQFGTALEKKMLQEVAEAAERAREERQAAELQRQLRLARDLGDAAFFRHPEAWKWLFENAAAEVDSATDLPAAQALVREGRKALQRDDTPALRTTVEKLWRLLPADVQTRRLGYESGVR